MSRDGIQNSSIVVDTTNVLQKNDAAFSNVTIKAATDVFNNENNSSNAEFPQKSINQRTTQISGQSGKNIQNIAETDATSKPKNSDSAYLNGNSSQNIYSLNNKREIDLPSLQNSERVVDNEEELLKIFPSLEKYSQSSSNEATINVKLSPPKLNSPFSPHVFGIQVEWTDGTNKQPVFHRTVRCRCDQNGNIQILAPHGYTSEFRKFVADIINDFENRSEKNNSTLNTHYVFRDIPISNVESISNVTIEPCLDLKDKNIKKDMEESTTNRMKHFLGIRNFFFKFAMWVAALFKGDLSKNLRLQNRAAKALENIPMYGDSDIHIEKESSIGIKDDNWKPLIPTYRDGNCALWSILTAVYGKEFIHDNFEFCRNTVIPHFRELINKKREEKNEAQDSNFGLGARNLSPMELYPVAKELQCDIAVITNQGEQSVAYLVKKDGETIINSQSGMNDVDRGRFLSALSEGHAIYGDGNGHHMWALDTKNAKVYDICESGTGMASSSTPQSGETFDFLES